MYSELVQNIIVIVIVVIALCIGLLVKNYTDYRNPQNLLELLRSEPLKRYANVAVPGLLHNKRPPDFIVGHKRIMVAYWLMTSFHSPSRTEIIALFQPDQKTPARSVNFINGRADHWTHQPAQLHIGTKERKYLGMILRHVCESAPHLKMAGEEKKEVKRKSHRS